MKPIFLLIGASLLVAPQGQAAPTKSAAKPAPKSVKKPAPKPSVKPTPKPLPFVAPVPTPTPEPQGPKTWALLVGVSRYENSGITSLKFPAKDAAALRDALSSPQIGGIPAKQILLLADEDATREKINGAVSAFLRPNVKEGDRVLVFLAGHGVAKGTGRDSKSFLLPTDTRGLTTAALESSAVSLRALSDEIGKLPASQFVMFVDACREDPTPGRGAKGNGMSDILSRGLAVVPENQSAESATFFACDLGERAFEDPALGHGVFTSAIVRALQKGTVAEQPDGRVDLGRLAYYVKSEVIDWAKDTSAKGNFEVSQTPKLVTPKELVAPLVILNSRKIGNSVGAAPSRAGLLISVTPPGAQISVNGARAGVGSVAKELPAGGEATITISAPGYAPVSRSVKAFGGYEQMMTVQLQPTAATAGALQLNAQAKEFYERALLAQERQQYEIAEQGFRAALGADAKFVAAHQALGELMTAQNRNRDAIAAALGYVAASPREAMSLAVLSRAYSHFAQNGAGDSNSVANVPQANGFGLISKPADAPKLAQRAAQAALAIEPNLTAGIVAQGYALAALDVKGKNKRDALAAWGKAAFADPTDPSTHLGLGYGIRFYAMQEKDKGKRDAEIARAIAALNEAVRLRPNFYEGHRELAFCYIALGNTAAALRECKLARANRGEAADADEIAGIEVAMAGLHGQIAQNSSGEKKEQNEAASQGYVADAKETSKNGDLKAALAVLNEAGVSSSLSSFLPRELLPLLDLKGTLESEIRGKLPGGLGGIRLPGF